MKKINTIVLMLFFSMTIVGANGGTIEVGVSEGVDSTELLIVEESIDTVVVETVTAESEKQKESELSEKDRAYLTQAELHSRGNLPKKEKTNVYLFPIREDIMPSAVRLTDKCLNEALQMGVDLIVIEMDTYGGLVDAADSIRTRLLNHPQPIYVFINNQAASAGALIAIAADRIYMRDGASIGAATVVSQDGQPLPDKYQSFMRGMMRSTAEAHGKVVDRVVGGDTTWRWYRDPKIAEAMVDPTIGVEGLLEKGKVLTFSTSEAIEWHYCEGKASSVEQLLKSAGIENYEITEYELTKMDRVLGFLTNPAFQGILIMLIIGGIYFELQSPGIGFPLVVALLSATLYFAPLYLEGLLAYWEIILFVIGVILVLVEVFVTPGFGVLGITGIVSIVIGLAFAMIDTDLLKYIPDGQISVGFVIKPIALVIISVTAALILSMWLGRRLLVGQSQFQARVVLNQGMTVEEGFVSHSSDRNLVGRRGYASTLMSPSGKVVVEGTIYEATGLNGQFIERGAEIVVVKDEGGVLYCRVAPESKGEKEEV